MLASGAASVGNGDDGVFIEGAPNNVVGGTSTGTRNLISGNGGDGVEVEESDGTGNRILRNSIFDNDDLGVNLDGGAENGSNVTANDEDDPDTDANNLQNCPVITSATTISGTTTVMGTLNSTADDTFILQFFSNLSADPSGFGEGKTFLGQTNVTTNVGGNTAFAFTTTSSGREGTTPSRPATR